MIGEAFTPLQGGPAPDGGWAFGSNQTPTAMRRVEHNLRINDVITRRLRFADPAILKNTYGFDRFGTRVWECGEYCILTVGKTDFLRACDLNFAKHKHPLPGVVDNITLGQIAIKLASGSRGVKIANSSASNLQLLLFDKDSNATLSNLKIINAPLGTNIGIDLAFVVSYGSAIPRDQAHRELEVMVAKSLSLKQNATDDR